MRVPDYIATAQANLLRTKLRTFLTVFAFVIGTFTLAMVTAFSQGLRSYLDTQLNAYGQANMITVSVGSTSTQQSSSGVAYYQVDRQTVGEGRSGRVVYTLSTHDLDAVRAVQGVQGAYPDYSGLQVSYVQLGNSQKYVLQVQSAVPGENTGLAAGAFPSGGQTNAIVLPYAYVEALGVPSAAQLIGKQVTLHVDRADNQAAKDYAVLVTGVLPDTLHVPAAYVSYQLLDDMVQFQSGNGGYFTDILAITAPTATKADRLHIKNTLQGKGYKVQTYDDILQGFSRPLNIVQAGLTGFAAVALLAATIGIVNTLLMAVLERTQEIGLLKALGMSRRGITFIYLIEAASIGFWGGIIGVLVAIAVGFAANPILSRTLFQGIGQTHLLAYPLPYMAGIVAGAMVIGLIAGTMPAIRAGRLDPIDALRRE